MLDGSSLGITIEKPFEILIKNKELINDESNGVEPLENAENTTKDSCESMQKTIWWAICEDVRNFSYKTILLVD